MRQSLGYLRLRWHWRQGAGEISCLLILQRKKAAAREGDGLVFFCRSALKVSVLLKAELQKGTVRWENMRNNFASVPLDFFQGRFFLRQSAFDVLVRIRGCNAENALQAVCRFSRKVLGNKFGHVVWYRSFSANSVRAADCNRARKCLQEICALIKFYV